MRIDKLLLMAIIGILLISNVNYLLVNSSKNPIGQIEDSSSYPNPISITNSLLEEAEEDYYNYTTAYCDLHFIYSLRFDLYLSMYLIANPSLENVTSNEYIHSFLNKSTNIPQEIYSKIIDYFEDKNKANIWEYLFTLPITNNFSIIINVN